MPDLNQRPVSGQTSGLFPKPVPIARLAIIGVSVAVVALAFAYTAGWLSPHRLTPTKLVTAVQPPDGPTPGHRRNHARGICFTGTFNANGQATSLSKAKVFETGEYPVVGRFNVAGGELALPEPKAQVHGFSVRILTPDNQEWRMAMIDAPFFAAATPQDFFAFLTAAGSKDPNAIKQFLGGHPETLKFIGWAKDHPRNHSWTEDRFNSLNSFEAIDASGATNAIRWSFVPSVPAEPFTADELAKQPSDYLEQDIVKRVAAGPQHYELVLTVANPGDPTANPTIAWPADRRTIDAGTLVISQIVPEADGPCRDINYDPSVLPTGITTSDDAFPAARSAAYRVSYDKRIAESDKYPHTPVDTPTGGKQ